MTTSDIRPVDMLPQEPDEATLVFREQADGRRVSRLPGGKVVLVDLKELDRVSDGEQWHVRLRHRETFAIAEPICRVSDPAGAEDASASAASGSRPGDAVLRSPADAPPAPAAAPMAPASAGHRARPEVIPAVSAASAPAEVPSGAAPAALGAPNEVRSVIPPLWVPERIEPAKVVSSTDRVALFVDGANMDGACRHAGYFVDYRKAREYFLASGKFNAGFYYIADFTAQDPFQQRFLDFLSYAGFIVRRKPVKIIRDQDTGERLIKGNLDTEIVLDMLNTVGNYDLAFLFSGDSDFERAVDLLRSRGKRVYVVTSRQSLSRELGYVADKPIFFLEEFKDVLMREDRRPVVG